MKPRLLIVDDDGAHRTALKLLLEEDGFSVAAAGNAAAGLAAARKSRPDLVLCDVAMPGGSGVELCRKLKRDPRTASVPVLLMSGARKAQPQQARGIEGGADDYLLKPILPRLLLAKVRAALRREGPGAPARAALEAAGLALDPEARTASLRGRPLALTRKEFDFLAALLKSPGRVVGRARLLETVWGYDPSIYDDPHTIETHASSLRRKLGARLGRRLVTVPGLGYRFD